PLNKEHVIKIMEIQLKLLRKRLAARKLTLDITDRVKTQLVKEGYDPVFGARPLKRVIQQRLQNPLALKLLEGEFKDGQHLMVDLSPVGELIFKESQ
ncbi:MAG TPA: type VI secretion system ATPase TssH, partial [Desulfitobacteriaceae bacterium]|nr:type VI secretion system ATPase TssH [Desulfitobacteriaceae bacterium]